MRTLHGMLKQMMKLGLLLIMGASMNADAGFLGFGGTSWKEEVLLHDGSKIIVKRSVDRGGRHEIGQQPPIKEQSLTFNMPKTDERITWKSEFSEDVGLADFQPLLLDIFQGTAYVVTDPVGCLAYNKWDRPNPPYVIFKYQNKAWQRITIQELPVEIKTPNIIFGSPDNHAKEIGKSLISVETIQNINSTLRQPEYKTILREPLPKKQIEKMCMVLFPDGKGGWLGAGWFIHPTQEACSQFCTKRGIASEFCKCILSKKGE